MYTRIFSFLSCFLALESSVDFPFCPSDFAITPCTCDEEGFNCRKAKAEAEVKRAMSATSGQDMARELVIQGTPIKRLSKGVFGRFQFSKFHIDLNQLTKIESGVFKGSKSILKFISLYGNRLTDFPYEDVQDLPYLEDLLLSKNNIEAIPALAFGTTPHKNLRFVYLNDNKISMINGETFSALINLDYLDLGNNRLTHLFNDAFTMLPGNKLFGINLMNNQLMYIQPQTFDGLPNLKYLILIFNNLTYLASDPFQKLFAHGGKIISFTGNPFKCEDCERHKWLVDDKEKLINQLFEMKCTNGISFPNFKLSTVGC